MTTDEAIMTLGVLKNKFKAPTTIDLLETAIKALERDRWIPFRLKEGLNMLQEPIPKDGQEILITVNLKGNESVQMDTFIVDYGECYLDSGYDFVSEAVAWKPKPEPWKGLEK